MPYSILIFLYDEFRKFLFRSHRRIHPGKISFIERLSDCDGVGARRAFTFVHDWLGVVGESKRRSRLDLH